MRIEVASLLILIAALFANGAERMEAHSLGNVRIAARPIVMNERGLASAALQKTTAHGACRATRLALVDPSFSSRTLAVYGWHIVSRVGDVVTLQGPAAVAPYLGVLDGVRMVKQPSRVFPLMDTVRKYCGINQAQGTADGGIGRSFSGKGVLFGIIDTDFDVHHPAFSDSDGFTRFIALWDQKDSSGAASNRFGYGTIKDQFGLNADLKFGLRGIYHGTTMASYAVGSQQSLPFYGVAPDVLIAGVCMGDLDNGIVDGLRWLFSLADSLGMPCVVNMSLGYHDGPHDGTSLVDRVIDSLSGPGRIIVGSAGNDGDKKAHAWFNVGPGDTAGTWALGISIADSTNRESANYGIEIWGERNRPFSVSVRLLDTVANHYFEGVPVLSTDTTISYEPDTLVFSAVGSRSDTVIVEPLTEAASALNGNPHMQIWVSTNRVSILPGVRITSVSATTIQAWNMTKRAFVSLGMSGFLEGDSIMSVNELGGTAHSNITVGAYTSKLKYTLYDGSVKDWGGADLPWHFLCGYSSHGPTADGRIKPDITAPGSDLIGAMPCDAKGGSIVVWPDTFSTVGRYWASGGTSASAPVVAGIVALMLEADSSLTPQTARSLIQETALTDATTGPIPTPNIFWGAGRVNAIGALAKLLGINVRPRTMTRKIRPDHAFAAVAPGRYQLTGAASAGATVDVVSLAGRVIARIKVDKNGIFPLSGLPSGSYIMQAARSSMRLCAAKITVIEPIR
jgi:minor extracellular serine protease Vpr